MIADYDEKDFTPDLSTLEQAIGKNTAAVIVNSPNNPSGVVYSKDTIEKIAAVLTRKKQRIRTPDFYNCGRTVPRTCLRCRSAVYHEFLRRYDCLLQLFQVLVFAGRTHRLYCGIPESRRCEEPISCHMRSRTRTRLRVRSVHLSKSHRKVRGRLAEPKRLSSKPRLAFQLAYENRLRLRTSRRCVLSVCKIS